MSLFIITDHPPILHYLMVGFPPLLHICHTSNTVHPSHIFIFHRGKGSREALAAMATAAVYAGGGGGMGGGGMGGGGSATHRSMTERASSSTGGGGGGGGGAGVGLLAALDSVESTTSEASAYSPPGSGTLFGGMMER